MGGEISSLPQCTIALELESGISFRTRHKLRTSLPPLGQESTDIEVRGREVVEVKSVGLNENITLQVSLTAGDFILDRFYFRKQASEVDIRKTLADVRMMRLILTCSQVDCITLFV